MKINVAYGVDENFTRHAYVSVFSILKNMKKEDVLCCYLLTNASNKNISIIQSLGKRFSNFELNVVVIDGANMDKIQVSEKLDHINSATYYRFGVELIEGVEKIIYLDSDVIVDFDISELFKEDLCGKIVGVCSDAPKHFIELHINELGLKRKKYFNAGVLLIDLKKWRGKKVSQKCLELLKERVYKFNDQDVLNIILQDDCKWLPGNYNVQSGYFPGYFGEYVYIGFKKDYYEDAVSNPKIIHFTGKEKPRNLFPTHPFRHIYGKYFLGSLSINFLMDWKILKECGIVLIHDIEDLFFSYNMQKKLRRNFRDGYNRFKELF